MKKILILTLVLFVGTGFSSYSQDKDSEIKKLLSLMNSEKMMQETMRSMMNVMKQQLAGKVQGENAEQKKEKLSAILVEESTKMMTTILNEDMVGIYGKYFTEAEIKDLIVFYQSATGKKYLEKTPAITGELMTAMMQKHLPAMQQRLKAKFDELK